MKVKILVIASHPDNETLGCGANITGYAHEGADDGIRVPGRSSPKLRYSYSSPEPNVQLFAINVSTTPVTVFSISNSTVQL